jgi:hypothetical protein
MAKALDSGKAFIDGVLAKLPEGLRESARAAFTAPEAADALTAVGDGVLARADYSKMMDDLRVKEETLTSDFDRLNTWFETIKPKAEGYDALAAEVVRLKGQPPTVVRDDKPAGMTDADFDKKIEERERAAATYFNTTNALSLKHFQTFGDVLDLNDLVVFAQKSRLPILDAYQQKFAEPLQKKAQEQEDLRINKLVEAKLVEERKRSGGDQPFPLKNSSPSVLDILEQPDRKPTDHTVDTAVAEYDRLQSARG